LKVHLAAQFAQATAMALGVPIVAAAAKVPAVAMIRPSPDHRRSSSSPARLSWIRTAGVSARYAANRTPLAKALLESFAVIVSQDICARSAARYAACDLIEAKHDKWDIFDLAMTDPLPRARNRRAFSRFAEREVPRAGQRVKPLTALRHGIDHVKRVNDVHGHAGGGEVLTRLAACLTASLGEEDLPGRPGGEEFAMVLPGTEPLRAAIPANRLRPGRSGPPLDEGKNREK
jgi:GGDEF domain-containing protein